MEIKNSEILTDIVLSVFRLNGEILQSGDRLVKPLNLTSARWQVMGAVALSEELMTVPQIAAAMGITRQGVQKQVNALVEGGVMTVRPNPRNKKSPFILLTKSGSQVYTEVDSLWNIWASKLATGISKNDLKVTFRTLKTIRKRLQRI